MLFMLTKEVICLNGDASTRFFYKQHVGNKAKERISKRVFQESKARQNFRKTNISYPLIRTRKLRQRAKAELLTRMSQKQVCLFQ